MVTLLGQDLALLAKCSQEIGVLPTKQFPDLE